LLGWSEWAAAAAAAAAAIAAAECVGKGVAGIRALAFFKTFEEEFEDLSLSRTFSMSRKRRFLGETSVSIRSIGAAVVNIFFESAFSTRRGVIEAMPDRAKLFFFH
jgi:hypothetical protein